MKNANWAQKTFVFQNSTNGGMTHFNISGAVNAAEIHQQKLSAISENKSH